ncbi:MAG: oligosaccharide flippase family protein [Deltaproteobacteria bacterium]|nr:oligosaccharide flippase family protein [Deltaproteobacteria bacterium]
MIKVIQTRFFKNLMTLQGINVLLYLFPLFVIPYLVRVLGPDGWGFIAFSQSFAMYIALIVEYGFNYSGTREVAQYRENPVARSETLAGILGAKMGISALALLLSPLFLLIPSFGADPLYLWGALFLAIAHPFNMIWYYQGLEQLRAVAIFEISSRMIALGGIFMFVRVKEDAWKVLVIQATMALISAVSTTVLAYQKMPFRVPSLGQIVQSYKMGWALFIYRGAVSLYTVGNAFVLGLFVPLQFVGYYAGAEKICRAGIGLLSPISQIFFTRLSHLVSIASEKASKMSHYGMLLMGSSGLLMGAFLFLAAPVIIPIALGKQFGPAVQVLQILALLPPLTALSDVMGIQWMIPLHLENVFNKIILSAGLLNLALVVILTPRFAHLGMAWAVVISELMVTSSLALYFKKRGFNPFSLASPIKI